MASKNRRPSVDLVRKWIKQGYGQGQGEDYLPWIYVRDVPSKGASSVVHSQATKRVHHYLSRNERDVHLIAEYCGVVDIREQYALIPWGELQQVAAKVGIKYPIYPYTSTPLVMTTDLVLTVKRPDGRRFFAVAVKTDADLQNPRVIEKLWLERFYWMDRGIDWILHVAKDGAQSTVVKNLLFFIGALRHANHVNKCPVKPAEFSAAFERNWRVESTLNEICQAACLEVGLSDIGDGIRQLGAAVWRRQTRLIIDGDLINHDSPVRLTEKAENV